MKKTTKFLIVALSLALILITSVICAFATDAATEAIKVVSKTGEERWYGSDVTLSAVIANASDGDVITAYSDIDIDQAIYVDKSITLDLGGNTVTTTGYIIPDGNAYITVKNGTVDVTQKELAQLYEGRSANTTLELNNLAVKKGTSAANRYFLDVRAGNVVMDCVTVNEGEWNIPSSSASAFITAGYRTKSVSQPINFTFRDCHITLPKTTFISGTGASGETNGYALDIDITDSYISAGSYVLNLQPASTAMDNCWLDIAIDGASTMLTGSGFTNQVMFKINPAMKSEQVVIRADFGVVFSKLPRIAVGQVLLGDGDDILDYDDETTYGFVADLWADDYTPVTDYEYSFCIVGDTQMTIDYDPNYMNVLYDWIVANKDAKKMKYVFGMGDITNHSADDEWQIAYNEITKLDGVIDYSIIRGNHDTSEGLNATFNNETYKSQFDGFFSEDLIENAYVTFTAGDVKYLHITLDWRASDAVLSWASGIIRKYYDHRVIISTHANLSAEGTLLTEGASAYGTTNSGEQMWNKLFSQHENIFLVLSGHVFSTELVCLQSKGVHGNTVTQLMTNGQTLDYRNGAVGLVSMLYFSADGKTVDVEYYSTVFDKYLGKNSQFTLTVPEYAPTEPETPDYLYSITRTDGKVDYYDSTVKFSDIMTTHASNGCIIDVFGNISIDTGFKVQKYLSLNLNGHTLSSDGGKIQGGNTPFNITGGVINVTKTNPIYIGEGYANTVINLSNLEIIHSTDSTGMAFVDLRDGTVNLDNVKVTASGWNNLAATFITAGYRTKSASRAINVNLKNSSIDLGSGKANFLGYTGASTETYGWCGNLSVTNSDITAGNYIVQAKPASGAAANCALNLAFDGRSTIVATNFFNIADTIPTANVSISFDAGAKLSTIPSVTGVTISYSEDGVLSYDSDSKLYVVTSMANVGCMLVDENGEVYSYYDSLSFTKELVALAQNAGCSIKLLKDMEMPAGASSSNKYAITTATLTIDLNGKTLTMPSFAVFTTDKNTRLTIKNGTIKHAYTVFYSYSGNASVTSCTIEDVTLIGSSTYAAFDHRIGTLSLTDCTLRFTNTPKSANAIFTFGYVNNATNNVYVNLNGCTIDATEGSDWRSIFKLYGGRPVTLTATDCSFAVGSSAYLIHAVSSYTTAPTDSLTFTDCEISKAGEDANLLSIAYDDITVTLDEVHVPCGSTFDTDNGTVSYAKGQTKADIEGGGYLITAPKINIEANLTLYTDFTLNIWLPTNESATKLTVDGVEYLLSDAEQIDGKYLVSLNNIGANTAADGTEIYITYVDGDKTLTVMQNYSVVKYAKAVLSSDSYTEEIKSLLVYALNYIEKVYIYDNKDVPAALSELLSSEAYTKAAAFESTNGVEKVPSTQTSTGTANKAIYSAKLWLNSSTHFILKINPQYTGSLTLKYCGNEYTYEVTEGKANGLDYIIIDMRAYALYNEIIYVKAGEYSGTYDLAAYINGASADAMLSDMLLQLYNYCKEAKEYKAYVASSGELN